MIKRSYVFQAVLILSLILLFLSCAGSKMEVIDDPELNHIVYRLTGLSTQVTSKDAGAFGTVSFRTDMYISRFNNDTSFYLAISSLLKNPIPFTPGYTVELNIDGIQVQVSCHKLLGSRDTVKFATKYIIDYYMLDGGWYRIDRPIIKALANAKSVAFLIHGENYSLPGQLTDDSLDKIQRFYRKYVGQI